MKESPTWQANKQADYQLKPHQIHIWRLFLPLDPNLQQQLYTYLNPEELERAHRYHFQKDTDLFISARGSLRWLLAKYLKLSPAEIILSQAEHGKPYVAADQNTIQLEFNVSHSHLCVMYAFTLQHPIGIDVEYPKDNIDFKGIAERFFSLHEIQDLHTLPPENIAKGFYNAWTRKEAYIKAIGKGLSHALDEFDVSLLPNQPTKLLSIQQNTTAASKWTLLNIPMEQGYTAALTTPQPIQSIEYYDLNLSF